MNYTDLGQLNLNLTTTPDPLSLRDDAVVILCCCCW